EAEAAFVVVGDFQTLAGRGESPVRRIHDPAEVFGVFADAIPVIDRPAPAPVTPGQPDVANGAVVADWIEEAVNLVLGEHASGLVTAPIAEAPLYAAGFRFPGHTEFIAELTSDTPYAGTRGPVMMLTARDLRACLVTIHVALDQAPQLVTDVRIRRTAQVVHECLKRDFGIARPRLAMAVLNPHAGEGG